MQDFKFIDKGNLLPPGKCATCGAVTVSPREYYVDLGYEDDWFGRMYMCNECVKNLAKLCDYYSASYLDTMRKSYQIEIDSIKEFYKVTDLVFSELEKIGIDVSQLKENVRGGITDPEPAIESRASFSDSRAESDDSSDDELSADSFESSDESILPLLQSTDSISEEKELIYPSNEDEVEPLEGVDYFGQLVSDDILKHLAEMEFEDAGNHQS